MSPPMQSVFGQSIQMAGDVCKSRPDIEEGAKDRSTESLREAFAACTKHAVAAAVMTSKRSWPHMALSLVVDVTRARAAESALSMISTALPHRNAQNQKSTSTRHVL